MRDSQAPHQDDNLISKQSTNEFAERRPSLRFSSTRWQPLSSLKHIPSLASRVNDQRFESDKNSSSNASPEQYPNQPVHPVGKNESASKDDDAEVRHVSKPYRQSSRSPPRDHVSEADIKLMNFHHSREAGKHVCVCGAAAYYERENVLLAKERLKLKHEAHRIQVEVGNMQALREKINERVGELEERDQKMRVKESLLANQEQLLEEERAFVESQQKLYKQKTSELDDAERFFLEQEKLIEVQKRKLNREKLQVQEMAEAAAEEMRRANELAAHFSESQAKLLEEKNRLSEELSNMDRAKSNLYSTAEEVERIKTEYTTKLMAVERERTKLARWEEELISRDKIIEEQRNDVNGLRLVNKKTKEVLDMKERDLEHQLSQLSARKLEIERQREELESLRSRFAAEKSDQRQAFDQTLAKKEKALREQQEALEVKQTQLKAYEERLQKEAARLTSQAESLAETQATLVKLEEYLDTQSKLLDQQRSQVQSAETEVETKTEQLQVLQQALDEQRAALDQQKASFEERKAAFEETKSAEAKQLQLMKDALTEEKKYLQEQMASALRSKEQAKKREEELEQREKALQSQEARSEWHQSVLKDVYDAKDRLELQMKDLELEKHAFEEKCCAIAARNDRIKASLSQKEKTLANLEVQLKYRAQEIDRKGQLLELRLQQAEPQVKRKLLTVPSRPPSRFLDWGEPLATQESIVEPSKPHLRIPSLLQSNPDLSPAPENDSDTKRTKTSSKSTRSHSKRKKRLRSQSGLPMSSTQETSVMSPVKKLDHVSSTFQQDLQKDTSGSSSVRVSTESSPLKESQDERPTQVPFTFTDRVSPPQDEDSSSQFFSTAKTFHRLMAQVT